MPTMGIPPQLAQNSVFNNISMKQENKPPSAENKGSPNILDQVSGRNHLYREKNNKMGKDDFLRLLTQQLQNQDPSRPADQAQLAAELAQFSQLEQLSNIQAILEKQGGNANAENKFYAASFLGKKVMTSGSHLEFKGHGTSAPINFYLDQDAQKAQIRIFDQKSNLVAQIDKENMPRGAQTITWDGSTLDLAGAGKGEYTFQVKAWDQGLKPINVETKASGVVTGVRFENGETMLIVDGKKVNLKEVESFELNDTTPAANREERIANSGKVAEVENRPDQVQRVNPLIQNFQKQQDFQKSDPQLVEYGP